MIENLKYFIIQAYNNAWTATGQAAVGQFNPNGEYLLPSSDSQSLSVLCLFCFHSRSGDVWTHFLVIFDSWQNEQLDERKV